jgi:hypothetical protein
VIPGGPFPITILGSELNRCAVVYFLSGTLFYLYRHLIPWSIWLAVVALAGVICLAGIPEWRSLPLVLPVLATYLFFYLA